MRVRGSLLVAPEPLAADVATEIFAEGGNAVDAAVAVAFAQGVVNPVQCGIGGNGSLTLYLAEQRLVETIDFGEVAGSRVHPLMWYRDFLGQARPAGRYLVRGNRNTVGYQAVAVPGFVRGMHAAWETAGTLPWARLITPAIHLAAEGFSVYPYLDRHWRRPTRPPYVDALTTLTATAASAAIYMKDGTLFEVGDTLVQSDLAGTLREIAGEGAETFYRGSVAERIAEDFSRNGGLITGEDLERYPVRTVAPLMIRYRGYRIVTEAPPGSGLQVAQMLSILEGFDLRALGWHSPEYVRVLAEAMKIGFADKVRHIGDPDFTPVPVDHLLSPDHIERHRQRIRDGERATVPLIKGTAPDAATPNAPPGPGTEPGGTTHLSVVDRSGNAASLTHSICSSSGVVTPGLGFLYNNCMDQYCPDPGATPNPLEPGRRRSTGSCTTIVFRGEEPFLVIGASGGNNIPTSVVQTILNIIDHDMPVQAAVHSPRVHCEGGPIEVEAPVAASTCRVLEGMGYAVTRSAHSFGDMFGCVQAVQAEAESHIRSAGADPRGGGGVAFHRERED